MVGQCLDYIGHAHLQDDVHSTLKVESQTDTHLAAFLEGPCFAVHLVVEQRVHVTVGSVLSFRGGKLCSFTLEVVRHH